jgi:hypothetical protein
MSSDQIETPPSFTPASMSREVDKLAAALAKAQGKIEAASKDRVNPHFRSAYATLSSVWDACRQALSENGLAVTQLVAAEGNRVTVTTLLLHASGQWIRSELTTQAKGAGPQDLGSAITYCRRYGLSAAVGVAPDEDDDGNQAQGKNPRSEERPPPAKPEPPAAEPRANEAPIIDGWRKKYAAAKGRDAVKAVRDEFNKESYSQTVRDAVRAFYEAAVERVRDKPPGKVTQELLDMAAREPGQEG